MTDRRDRERERDRRGVFGAGKSEEQQREEHFREVLKMCFEYFKHFTTIATASVLVELALYQQLELSPVAAIGGVVAMVLVLLLSLAGMIDVPIRAGAREKFLSDDRLRWVFSHMGITAIFFIVGISTFVYGAVGPDRPLGFAIATIMTIVISFLAGYFIKNLLLEGAEGP